MFDEYGTGFLLIGGLVLWYFIGMLTNSISESKKLNGNVEKDKTKHSKKNRTPAKHIKENRYPSAAYILFNLIIAWVSALINLFAGFIAMPILGPIIIFIVILWIFV